MSKPVKPFLFLHIPKSAGSTFQSIINSQYRFIKAFNFYGRQEIEAWDKLSNQERSEFKVVKGHFNFSENFHPSGGTYFTFLRNPIDRIISHYHYLKTSVTHAFYAEMQIQNYTLKQMLQNGKIKQLDNLMVRKLSNAHLKNWNEVNEDDLKLAIYNFDTYFEYFGLVEKFDESLVIMTYELGWSMPYYYTLNESKNKKENYDTETLNLLEHFSRFDKVLWQHAKQKFELKLEKYNSKIHKDLATFRKSNKRQAIFRKLFYKLMRVKNVK